MRLSRPVTLILAFVLLLAVDLLSRTPGPSLLRLVLPFVQAIAQEGGGGEQSTLPTTGPTDSSGFSPWVQAGETEAEHGDQAVRPVSLATIQNAIQDAAPGEGSFVVVRQRNKFFDPPVVVIHEGDTVVWVNETAGGWHDVQSYEGEFSSERMVWGDTFVRTFDQAGVYGYFCSPHVFDGMQGAVVVLPDGAPLPDPLPVPDPLPHPSSAPAESLAPETSDTIVTVAGGGGTGGPATDASLYLPEGVAVDEAGRLYIADTGNCQVRRVQPAGTLVSILGHESCGFSMGADADIGPWLHANHPRGAAVGPDGALFIADTINCRVRTVNESARVATVAGNGSCRASGDGGPAVEAGLIPWGLAWDAEENLYIADVFNCRVRKVDEQGIISTVAGDGSCGFSGDGGVATGAQLFFPRDVAAGPDGVLYIADSENCRVRRIDPATGIIDTVVGNGDCTFRDGLAAEAGIHPWAVAVDAAGDVLVADRENCRIRRFSSPDGTIVSIAGSDSCGSAGDGGPATEAALHWPSDITLAGDGTVYIADTGSCRIRTIDRDGVIDTVAGSGVCAVGGDGGSATAGGSWHAMGLAFGAQGNWYVSELDTCKVRRVDAAGVVTTYAGNGICGHSGDGGPATEARLGDFLGGLALADDGSLFVADGFNCRVRRIASDQSIETIAGNGVCGFSGDGGPAREASLDLVFDVALDGNGSLYLAGPFNCRVRRVNLATGIIDTVVGNGSCSYNGEDVPAADAGVEPWGVAVGPDGALYVADSGNSRVRRVGAEGRISTVAGGNEFCDGNGGDGGQATEARLLRPYDVVLDQAGNIYISDLRGFVVRKVDRRGIITTVAGVGISRPVDNGGTDPTNGVFCSIHSLPVPAASYLGDGGPASQAGLYFPYAVALGFDEHLYIADTFDHRVRRVTCGGSVPCAGPARPTASTASEETPAAVAQLPSTGQPARSAWSSPVVGLLAVFGVALLLVAASVVRARVRRNR